MAQQQSPTPWLLAMYLNDVECPAWLKDELRRTWVDFGPPINEAQLQDVLRSRDSFRERRLQMLEDVPEDVSQDVPQDVPPFYSPVPIIQAPTLPPAYQRLPDLPELVPTNKALQARGATLTPPSLPERLVNSAYRETFDFRPGYRGDVTLRDNRPNATTSDNNCALWLTGLPAGTTESDLEAALLALPGPPVGGIWTMSVVPPDPKSGHQDAAANISFTRVVAATRLLEHIQDPWHRGFFVGGQRVKGKWNRNRVAPQPPWHRPRRSRVLVITGPRDFVNVASLHDWLSRYVAFVTTGIDVRYDAAAAALAAIGRRYDGHLDRPDQEEWVRRANVGEYVTLVWRFACARGQACIAMSCLHRLREDLALNVRCSYGDDPCEGASWR